MGLKKMVSKRVYHTIKFGVYRFFFSPVIIVFVSCQSITSDKENYRNRLLFHLSSENVGSKNPNLAFYSDGKYHLFFKNFADDSLREYPRWKHLISKDLLKWEELPVNQSSDSPHCVFYGNAVVDSLDTSGFGKDGKTAVLSMYSKDSSNVDQYLIYSLDEGRTWEAFGENPVISDSHVLKPYNSKIVWDDIHGVWVVAFSTGKEIIFYKSKNLRKWRLSGKFEKSRREGCDKEWKYPDLFPLKVDGSGETKWILMVNSENRFGVSYFVGNFDGNTFKMDSDFLENIDEMPLKMSWYKSLISWDNGLYNSNYRIVAGWLENNFLHSDAKSSPRGMMTIPMKIRLKKHHKSYRLSNTPVNISSIRSNNFTKSSVDMEGKTGLNELHDFELSHSEISFVVPAKTFRINFSTGGQETTIFGYDKEENIFYSDSCKVSRESKEYYIRVRLLVDKTSAEVFFDGGLTTMTRIFPPLESGSRINIHPINPDKLQYLEINQLK